jgi:hypothetical protein
MPVNFSPHRQGAAHSIEQHHILLLRGTPVYDSAVGTIDTRICIHTNGSSDRAMWLLHPKHMDALGLNQEFHLWNYKLSEQHLNSIRELLTFVHRAFVGFEPILGKNDAGDSLTFWVGKDRFSACLLRPLDARHQYSDEQIAAFMNVCNLIYKLVPQPTSVVSDWLRQPT